MEWWRSPLGSRQLRELAASAPRASVRAAALLRLCRVGDVSDVRAAVGAARPLRLRKVAVRAKRKARLNSSHG